MASTNFDMDSDESFHRESEFHYPDGVENHNDKENTGLLREENSQSFVCHADDLNCSFKSVQAFFFHSRLLIDRCQM